MTRECARRRWSAGVMAAALSALGVGCVVHNPEYDWLPEPPPADTRAKPVPVDAGRSGDTRIVADLLVQDLAPPPDTRRVDQRLLCLGGESSHDDGCYRVLQGTPLTRDQAAKACAAQGASLVTIGDAAENGFAYSLLPATSEGAWLGLKRTGKGKQDFVWDSGAKLSYTQWAPGEPNDEDEDEQCVIIWGPALSNTTLRGYWNDAPCDWPARDAALCKRVPLVP
jgi:hypothetical protein